MATTTESLARLLQITDSAFPTGGYAHSYGLEELVRCGVVRDEATLAEFICRQALPALAHVDLPLLRDAHAADGRAERLIEVDRLAGAFRLPRELREASRQVGRRRLASLRKIRPSAAVATYAGLVDRGEAEGHHVVAFACACAGMPVRDALAAYVYQAVAGFCTASLKLIRIGQEGAQRVLAGALEGADEVIDRALALPPGEIGWFDPVLDLASMHHEIANERLFIS